MTATRSRAPPELLQHDDQQPEHREGCGMGGSSLWKRSENHGHVCVSAPDYAASVHACCYGVGETR